MNYRHIYHAGNFADIFKHLVMWIAAEHLLQKDKGLLFLDAFAGCGIYDISSSQAQRTGEALDGAGRFMDAGNLSGDLLRFQSMIAPFWDRKTYPGSPLLLAQMMRAQDRLVANELHPEDYDSLQLTLGRFSAARTTRQDAYECVRALIPPEERRGLVLVDPPFEKKNEFELLVRQMKEWKKRWPTGCFMIWYPIKAHLPVDAFYEAATELGMHRTWAAEFLIHERDQPDTFNGCGVMLFNTPFQLPEKVEALAPVLCEMYQARMDMAWLSEE